MSKRSFRRCLYLFENLWFPKNQERPFPTRFQAEKTSAEHHLGLPEPIVFRNNVCDRKFVGRNGWSRTSWRHVTGLSRAQISWFRWTLSRPNSQQTLARKVPSASPELRQMRVASKICSCRNPDLVVIFRQILTLENDFWRGGTIPTFTPFTPYPRGGPFNCTQEILCKEEFKFPQNLFLNQLSVCELSPNENGNFVSHGNTFYEEVRIDVLEVLHSCRAKIESVKAYKNYKHANTVKYYIIIYNFKLYWLIHSLQVSHIDNSDAGRVNLMILW